MLSRRAFSADGNLTVFYKTVLPENAYYHLLDTENYFCGPCELYSLYFSDTSHL